MVDFIKGMLFAWGVLMFISSIIYMFIEGEQWFSRFVACILCFGFSGVIRAIEEKKI